MYNDSIAIDHSKVLSEGLYEESKQHRMEDRTLSWLPTERGSGRF
jgi:hypothetical protein